MTLLTIYGEKYFEDKRSAFKSLFNVSIKCKLCNNVVNSIYIVNHSKPAANVYKPLMLQIPIKHKPYPAFYQFDGSYNILKIFLNKSPGSKSCIQLVLKEMTIKKLTYQIKAHKK